MAWYICDDKLVKRIGNSILNFSNFNWIIHPFIFYSKRIFVVHVVKDWLISDIIEFSSEFFFCKKFLGVSYFILGS